MTSALRLRRPSVPPIMKGAQPPPVSKSVHASPSPLTFGISMTAAGLSHMVHHPLYTLKSHMMMHGKKFKLNIFVKNTFSNPLFLYRGFVARTIGVMPEKALKMQALYMTDTLLFGQHSPGNLISWLATGSAAGIATTIIGCPSERIMVLAQIHKQGMFDVIRHNGIRELYKGVVVTSYRDITFNAAFFTVTEMLVSLYSSQTGKKCNGRERFVAGLFGGTVSSVIACPLDVVKTRVQGRRLEAPKESTGKILSNIVKNEGPRYLFKGLLPRLVAVPSMMSLFYMLNVKFNEYFLH